MRFYLGTSEQSWLAEAGVPTLIAIGALKKKELPPRATTPWALDSGGFSELIQHGKWRATPAEFVARVRGVVEHVGAPDFVGAQDWVCGPPALARTGLEVGDHQARTVENLVQLRDLAPEVPWLPTLQGWTMQDYDRHVSMYHRAGVDLTAEPLVGVGSIANRQHDPETGRIMRHLAGACGLRLHGFGVKKKGLRMYGGALTASDSASWSIDARYLRWRGIRPSRSSAECEAEFQAGTHPTTCAGCLRYALRWRAHLLESIEQAQREDQEALFTPDDTYRGPARTPHATFTDMGKLPESQQTEMEVE